MNLRRASAFVSVALITLILWTLNVLFGPAIGQASPLAQGTQDWRVYNNTLYGYSIMYPPDFYLYASGGPLSHGVILTNYDETRLSPQQLKVLFWAGKAKIEIEVLPKAEGVDLTLDKWMRTAFEKNPRAVQRIQTSNITIGGHNGTRQVFRDADRTTTFIRVFRDNFVYLISLDSVAPASNTILDSIVATLQFSIQIPSQTPIAPRPQTAQSPKSSGRDYNLPFLGDKVIINGPSEGMHVNASAEAIDFAPSPAASYEVRAIASGTVLPFKPSKCVGDFGCVIRIQHSDGFISFYAHLDTNNFFVSEGQSVTQGFVIAKSGNSGNGAGFHLHFEVRSNWNRDDLYSGQSVWVRDIPGISWNIEGSQDCPPCTGHSGAASSNIGTFLSYSIKFQGIDLPSSSKHVKLRLATTSAPTRYFYSTASTVGVSSYYNGRAALTNVSPGYYSVLVKGPGHLQKKWSNAYIPSGNVSYNWTGTPLKVGDVNQDNKITIVDVAQVLSKYTALTVPVPAGAEWLEDLNADNKINIMDVGLVLSNYTALTVPGDEWNTPLQSAVSSVMTLQPRSPKTRATNQGENWLWPVNISDNPGASSVPALTVDKDDNVHAVWADSSSGSYEIFYSKRSNSLNWSKPISVPLSTSGVFPAIAADGNGTVHVVWQRGTGGADIYYSYKTSSGGWSIPENVSNIFGTLQIEPDIAIDNNGALHVVWESLVGGNWEIFYASKPIGGSWSSDINISNDSVGSSSPAILIDDYNNVHVVWGGDSIQYISKQVGGGWTAPISVSNGSAGWEPTIALDSANTLHLVWRDNSQIHYSNKPYSGNWSTPTAIAGGVGGFYPVIKVDSDSTLHVVWNSSGEILYTKKESGLGWTAPYTISSNFGRSATPAMAVNSQRLPHVIWSDTSSGNEEVYHTYSVPSEGVAPITLTPSSATLHVGDVLPAEMRFDPKGMSVSGIAISITYSYNGSSPDFEVLDADPNKDGVQLQLNQALLASGWSVSVNEVKVDSGKVTINLALPNSETTGFVAASDILLATINFRVNRPFANKALVFDRIETKLMSKVDSLNIAQMQAGGIYSATGQTYLPIMSK